MPDEEDDGIPETEVFVDLMRQWTIEVDRMIALTQEEVRQSDDETDHGDEE